MRKYVTPVMEMTAFETKDIITVSNAGINETFVEPGGNIVICSDDTSIWNNN